MSTQPGNGCPPASMPGDFPEIPNNLSWVAIPGQNASVPWMVNCCEPYPVHVVQKCWLWCEVDPDVAEGASNSVVSNGFGACMVANKRNLNESNGLMYHRGTNAAAAPRVSLLHAVVAALATSVVVAMTSVV
ncbi:hypothetical protein F5144DRAFT_37791 [Chaetomium tenue]|uniref:Uncharacterized protein n=1 Tax=Chaetomium tenue TaxID=1854479 RepID=A0ACB7PMA8_9PEZI|nr:hypothetical protein F5144DRAFT_37791 [Chaetomium globosum]